MVNKVIAFSMMLGLSVSASAETVEAVMLKYKVSEAGIEPYTSRIIITDNMVRMDDDDPQGDYLLFDRSRQLISSVSHSDGTVLELPARDLPTTSPIVLKRNRSFKEDSEAPAIDGKRPHQLQLFVNEKLCYDAVVVPGLLPDSVKALSDLNRVLAGEQGKLLNELPGDVLEDCDLALHTFHPAWPLESGLAIQEFDLSTRRGRQLVDMNQTFKVDTKLFELPSGYTHYRTP